MNREKIITTIVALLVIAMVAGCASDQSQSEALAVDDMMVESRGGGVRADMSDSEQIEYEMAEDAGSTRLQRGISSAAAIVAEDTTRKFVRNAQLKFRVADALAATYDIESIVVSEGGFVVASRLNNRNDRVTYADISPDSTLAVIYSTLESKLDLRVPAANLDRTLRQIARNIEQLSFRDVQATDVTLDFLRYSLARKREERSARRAVQAIGRVRGDSASEHSMSPEELARDSEERADEALLSGLQLADRVAFATIAIELFERQQVRHEVVLKVKAAKAYRPGLGARIVEAFIDGRTVTEEVLLVVVRMWVLVVALAAVSCAWIIARRRRKKE